MELIERETAKAFVKKHMVSLERQDWTGRSVLALLDAVPAIDPIRAAGGCRCGECSFGRKPHAEDMQDGYVYCQEYSKYMCTDDFCSGEEPREARTMSECVYKTYDGHCTKHSDGIELREPCVRMDGPCDDESLPEPPKEDTNDRL